ncbi:hypothetical protein [Actinomadura verrucosospora]|uniref:Uncharacterized protein n=1 Tax=Actinomadura verrucosospora TaxID=46165 RepID=A0A7D4A2I2_ACTVE|nr:hypothetical protein [Actinomadura verrucosospora]QKG26906.1 hypothetical protein ACTIVE_8559 [Actinomadura verrucosospora]
MTVDPEILRTTRRSLHGAAELLLAGPQYRESGTIRLRVLADGFATVSAPVLRVAGAELVAGDRTIPLNGATCGELATAADVEAGAPQGLYKDGSGVGADETLDVDAGAAAHLEECFARGNEALVRLAPDVAPVLWPEHFDLAITLDEVNYGISPGDDFLGEPYAYAGPWEPRQGAFWNASVGAARPVRLLPGATALHDFFMEARDRAAHDPARRP